MTAPQTRFRYPRRTKIVVVAVLAVAVAGFTLGFMAYDSGDDPETTEVSGGGDGGGGRAVDPEVRVTPLRDADSVPEQETIVLQLEPGWAAELELRQPGRAPLPLPADQIEVTPLNQYVFDPDDGKVVESLPQGRNCVRYTAWSRVEGREASEMTDEWCFSVV